MSLDITGKRPVLNEKTESVEKTDETKEDETTDKTQVVKTNKKKKKKVAKVIRHSICFCAIFRNESRNVKRCLDAAKPIIDFISIVDTGSEDNTIELIREWGKDNDIPTEVHNDVWKNFEYNRTQSAKLARKSFPQADYLLLLDADMILKPEPAFSKSMLRADEYRLLQVNVASNLRYHNCRLIRASLSYYVRGVTHEYWTCDQTHTTETISENLLWIDDRDDGGHKADKYPRDERLLKEALANESTPGDLVVRYHFYLAQTLRNMGKYVEAIDYYRKRIAGKRWEEEIFFSYMQIGDCYHRMYQQNKKNDNLLERVVYAYLESYNFRPSRAEPLYYLAKLYREYGKNPLAVMYALMAKSIPYPSGDSLFIEGSIYSYLIDEELVISSYYVDGRQQKGVEAIRRMLKIEDKLPLLSRNLLKSNMKFYINKGYMKNPESSEIFE
jgi:glycosyltransferase involved in cell wall biosynthesis